MVTNKGSYLAGRLEGEPLIGKILLLAGTVVDLALFVIGVAEVFVDSI